MFPRHSCQTRIFILVSSSLATPISCRLGDNTTSDSTQPVIPNVDLSKYLLCFIPVPSKTASDKMDETIFKG